MLDYQKVVVVFFVCFLLSIMLIGLIGSAIKKHKAKKEYFAKLERENEQLREKIYRAKFNAELRGLKIDV